MKICYIGDSKSVHTLRFARHFAEKGNDVCIIDFNADKDDILKERIRVYTLKDDGEQFILPKKRLAISRREEKTEAVASKKLFLKAKIGIEYLYTWLIGYTPLIPRLPSWFLQLPFNSELIQMDRYAVKARKLLRKIKPDIVHSHYLTSWGYIAARIGFKPLISSAWGSDVLLRPNQSFAQKMKLQYAMNNSTLLTSDASCLSQKMISYGARKSKIKEFPWGVDLKKFFPLLKKNALPPTIIHTRTAGSLYNLEAFLKVIPAVAKVTPGLRVFLKNTGPLQNDIQMAIKELGLETTVKLLSWLSIDELAYYYRNSHIYVSLSKSDSTSISLLEAMASGCFPIVSNIPANREWIEDGINGFLVPREDNRILTKKIVDVFADKELRRSAGAKNLDIIRDRADWIDNTEALKAIYASLVKGAFKNKNNLLKNRLKELKI